MNTRITPEYWMHIAVDVAKAATCRANVGCVLIHKKIIVGMGYVGSVHGDVHCIETIAQSMAQHQHLLVKTGVRGSTLTGTSCIRTIHAEMNAILKCTMRGSREGGWIECYCTYQPCLECTKVLLQIGVRKMFYLNPYKDEWRDKFMSESDITRSMDGTAVDRNNRGEFIQVKL